jgi:hypothetical protein
LDQFIQLLNFNFKHFLVPQQLNFKSGRFALLPFELEFNRHLLFEPVFELLSLLPFNHQRPSLKIQLLAHFFVGLGQTFNLSQDLTFFKNVGHLLCFKG